MPGANGLPAQNNRILFVSHRKARCGVYEFGKCISDVLQGSRRFQFIRVECSSMAELREAIAEKKPAAIVYNYHRSVLPWLTTRICPKVYKSNIASIPIMQIGMIHEITQRVADAAVRRQHRGFPVFGRCVINSLFDFYIAADPTLRLRNPLVYKTGRPIPSYRNRVAPPERMTVGSLGFATANKGFEKIVRLVQREYDEAVIRLNIPPADFGDRDGARAQAVAENCRAQISKPGIQLQVTHDFLGQEAMLDFLAHNSINVFLYEGAGDRELSSAVDNAIAVKRPVAISGSTMFRHVLDAEPSICVNQNSLRTIVGNGFSPLARFHAEWSAENLRWDYERILDSIFSKRQDALPLPKGFVLALKAEAKRFLLMSNNKFFQQWSRDATETDDLRPDSAVPYEPIGIPPGDSFNRILDDRARGLYAPAIKKLTELVPRTMSRKIKDANVQQAFVFDTVFRHLPRFANPKILCVGSFEDTASMSLKKMGCAVEEIDPLLNYRLQEYATKPTTMRNSYDVVFATSVIEHDPDDESFVKCMADLLAPGGLAVLTCDYKDGWRPGEPKPGGNARFYTQNDLRNRLLPLMTGCRLIDDPQWDCPAPDFTYQGKYQYSFAAMVAIKET